MKILVALLMLCFAALSVDAQIYKLYKKITITTFGKKATIRLEDAYDQWNGKIFYIYSGKIQKKSKGLENFLYDD